MDGSIVIAPFANERLREWPVPNFKHFIHLCVTSGREVAIVGTRSQRARANELARGFSSLRVKNAAGMLSWVELVALVDSSRFVVANNSGVAHLAASRDVWTLCVFAASHSWQEWMPRGPRVVVITKRPACAPCEVGSGRCPNRIECMTRLSPDFAFDIMDEYIKAHEINVQTVTEAL